MIILSYVALGAQYPSVTIYMDGIADGITYYNQQKHKNVTLVGWDTKSQKGTFIGNFVDQNKAKTVTANMLDQNADVIIPVAGSLYQGAAAAVKSTGGDQVLEGVDADFYKTDTNGYKDLFLVSILKNVQPAVHDVVTAAAHSKTPDSAQYVGTLKNGGVGLSSFHGYASKVPPTLASELKAIQADIVSGKLPVSSPSSLS